MNNIRHNNTVPLKQSGEYYRSRAFVNRGMGRKLDALKLDYKALEDKPDDAQLMLEIAALLSEMKLHEASSSYITKAMLNGAPGHEVENVLLLNVFNREHSANKNITQILPGALTRRSEKRALRLLQEAFNCLLMGDVVSCKRFIDRALSIEPKSALTFAVTSLVFATGGSNICIDFARLADRVMTLKKEKAPLTLCAVALAQCASNDIQRAREILKLVDGAALSGECREIYLRALAITGMHKQIHMYCMASLGLGFDARLLHAQSVAAAALKLSKKQVMSGWETILEADKDNLVCRMFIKAYEEGRLRGEANEYYYKLTEAMRQELKDRLESDFLADGISLDALSCYNCDPELQEAGVRLLAQQKGKENPKKLIALSMRPDISEQARSTAFSLSEKQRGRRTMEKQYGNLLRYCEGGSEYIINHEALWVRRMRENIAGALSRTNKKGSTEKAVDMLAALVRNPHTRRFIFMNAYDAAAAICLLCLSGKNLSPVGLAVTRINYNLPPRRLFRMSNIIKNALKGQ